MKQQKAWKSGRIRLAVEQAQAGQVAREAQPTLGLDLTRERTLGLDLTQEWTLGLDLNRQQTPDLDLTREWTFGHDLTWERTLGLDLTREQTPGLDSETDSWADLVQTRGLQQPLWGLRNRAQTTHTT